MSFLNAFNALYDEYSLNDTEDSEISECVSDIDHQLLHLYMLIPSGLLTVALAFTIARRNLGMSCLWGRPGAIFPMDILGRSNRFSYAAAWGTISFLASDVIFLQKYAVFIEGPTWVKIFRALLSMLIYGMDYFPLFAALAIESVSGYVIGTSYAWLFLAINIFQVSECDLAGPARVILMVQRLPLLLSLLYLSISLPVRLAQSLRRSRSGLASSQEMVSILNTAKDVGQSVEALHVRNLLKPAPPPPDAPSTLCGKVYGILVKLSRIIIYRRHSYFRYSSRILSIMTVGVFLLYKSTVEILVVVLAGLRWAEILFDGTLNEIGWWYEEGEDPGLTKTRDTIYLGYYIVVSFRICFIVSISTALVLGLLMILHTLSSYRQNLFSLYKDDHEHIPPRSERSNASLLVGSMRYAGFQVGYIAWGYIIHFLILLLVTMAIATIVTLIRIGWTDWMVNMLVAALPLIIAAMIINVFQLLMAKLVFLQEFGKVLALDNRRILFSFTFFLFFYNIFLGIVSCLMRIIKSIIIGALFLPRLDHSALPRRFQMFDPGFAAYVGFVHVEAAHTHPVVLVFLRILMMDARARKKGLPTGDDSVSAMENGKNKPKKCGPRVSARARQRWHLMYTLYRNPGIRIHRKHYMDYMKEMQERFARQYAMSGSALGNLMKSANSALTPISVTDVQLSLETQDPFNAGMPVGQINWSTLMTMNKFMMALQKDTRSRQVGDELEKAALEQGNDNSGFTGNTLPEGPIVNGGPASLTSNGGDVNVLTQRPGANWWRRAQTAVTKDTSEAEHETESTQL